MKVPRATEEEFRRDSKISRHRPRFFPAVRLKAEFGLLMMKEPAHEKTEGGDVGLDANQAPGRPEDSLDLAKKPVRRFHVVDCVDANHVRKRTLLERQSLSPTEQIGSGSGKKEDIGRYARSSKISLELPDTRAYFKRRSREQTGDHPVPPFMVDSSQERFSLPHAALRLEKLRIVLPPGRSHLRIHQNLKHFCRPGPAY